MTLRKPFRLNVGFIVNADVGFSNEFPFDYDKIQVKIVRRQDYTDKDTEDLLQELSNRLGQDMQIEVDYVEVLSRTTAGKFRWVISEVPLGI